MVSEERYNKFTKEENVLRQEINTALENENNVLINEMGNFEKWIYFLFKKEM
ncbi:MAG: hypothetical protein LBU14_03520 [Candidatus Peribacteria bacterium]|nr:hypothetical protein [Candidatus Peribacteria bacterium]